MSLTVDQRPYQTINNEVSKWNAVGNPILYMMTRKDFSYNQANNSGGFAQLQFTGVNISSSFVIGDAVFYSTFGAATVTASAFSGGNTLVTLSTSFTTSSSGYVNNLTLRANYRVEVEVYDQASVQINDEAWVYSPNPSGVVTIDISSILKTAVSADNNADFSEVYEDTDIYTGFYIKYREAWSGSAESQTNDSANVFYTLHGARQIPSLYGGNLYDYLILSDMKLAEVTISTAQILTGNATPVTIVAAPGSGKVIVPVAIYVKLDYNSVAYATNTDFRFQINGVAVCNSVNGVLNAVADNWSLVILLQVEGTTTNIENQALKFDVIGGNPTAGNSPLYVRCIYTIVDAQ